MSFGSMVKDEDIIKELSDIDVTTLTPIDALNTLYKLQNKINNTSRVYTVKSGDSLIEIGQKLGVPWRELASKNGIVPNYVIRPGDRLQY